MKNKDALEALKVHNEKDDYMFGYMQDAFQKKHGKSYTCVIAESLERCLENQITVEELEQIRERALKVAVHREYKDGFNTAIDAVIERVKA